MPSQLGRSCGSELKQAVRAAASVANTTRQAVASALLCRVLSNQRVRVFLSARLRVHACVCVRSPV